MVMYNYSAGTCFGVLDTFLFWFLQDLGAKKYLMGITVTVGSVAGIPILVSSGFIFRKLGLSNTIILGFAFYVIRMLGEWLLQCTVKDDQSQLLIIMYVMKIFYILFFFMSNRKSISKIFKLKNISYSYRGKSSHIVLKEYIVQFNDAIQNYILKYKKEKILETYQQQHTR